jgi:DNA-binding XRE family transcriptional regulator
MENLESPLMRLRTLRRCSQKELAKAVGVSRQTISNWENGRVEPALTLSQYKALCKVLGIESIVELPDSFAPQPIHNRFEQNPN